MKAARNKKGERVCAVCKKVKVKGHYAFCKPCYAVRREAQFVAGAKVHAKRLKDGSAEHRLVWQGRLNKWAAAHPKEATAKAKEQGNMVALKLLGVKMVVKAGKVVAKPQPKPVKKAAPKPKVKVKAPTPKTKKPKAPKPSPAPASAPAPAAAETQAA